MNTYGQTIQDDPPITIFMGIIDNGQGHMNHVTDPYTNFNGEVSIEIRGSTSQQYPKKSYGFTPVDGLGIPYDYGFLGLPYDTDWILYAPYPDKTMMRNKLAYYMAQRMGHYSSRAKFVEVVRNGQYLGVYELQEKIKRDKYRVDISKLSPYNISGDSLTGGYIIKVDKTTGSGTEVWYSSYDSDVFFQYHYPKDNIMAPQQKNYINQYVDSFETALISPGFANPITGYRKYANAASFIDFYLLQELGRTVDGYRSSCFMYKDRDSKGGKLTMGPMWDFNLSYGNANYCDAYDTIGWQYNFNTICSGFSPHIPFWWNRLLQDPMYQDSARCRWEQCRATFLNTDSINHWIDSVATFLNIAQQRNYIKWPILGVWVEWNYFVGNTYQEEIDYLKMWIEARSKWLDMHIPGYCNPVGIAENKKLLKLLIAPNPSNGNFNVTFNNLIRSGSIEVISCVGKMVYKEALINQTFKQINLKDISPGFYIVKVLDGENILKGKIIVQ